MTRAEAWRKATAKDLAVYPGTWVPLPPYLEVHEVPRYLDTDPQIYGPAIWEYFSNGGGIKKMCFPTIYKYM